MFSRGLNKSFGFLSPSSNANGNREFHSFPVLGHEWELPGSRHLWKGDRIL